MTYAAQTTTEAPAGTSRRTCEMHGEYQSRNILSKIWSSCPKCVEDARSRDEEKLLQEEDDRRRRRWISQLASSGIPRRFCDRTFDDFTASINEQSKALEFARRLGDDIASGVASGRCAVFIGRPGTGKTHLAAAVAQHAMRANRTALFTTVTRLIRRIRDTYSRGSAETESQAVQAFTEPDLLVLDEVGVQRGTGDEKLLLFDVLNERYESRLSTIVLSNLSIEEVRGYLGERVFDRMREDGGEVVPFDWKSHRGGAAS